MKTSHVPKNRSYDMKAPSGVIVPVAVRFTENTITYSASFNAKQIKCQFVFGSTTVPRRVKFYGRLVRDKAGQPVTVQVPLKSTTLTMTIDGKSFKAVSRCKPPDKWNPKTGMKIALRHLLNQKEVHQLLTALGWNSKDYQDMVKVFLTKPPKSNQIKRAKTLAGEKGTPDALKSQKKAAKTNANRTNMA